MKASVVIIGGGVLGSSVAYNLTKKGLKDVILLEMNQIGSGSTSKSASMIMHQTGIDLLTRLAKLSMMEYNTYINELGAELGFQQIGSILFATKKKSIEKLNKMIDMQRRLGIETKKLSSANIKKLAPMFKLNDSAIGSYCPQDGYIDSGQIIQFYLGNAKKNGAQILEGTTAKDIKVSKGKVKGVITDSNLIKTSIVINAAGPLAHNVGQWVDIELPIENYKREIIIAEPGIGSFPIMENITNEWYFRPEGDKVLIGVGPTSKMSIDSKTLEPIFEYDALEKTANYIQDLIPEIKKPAQQWAGIRTFTPDCIPIIGPIENINGYINCCAGCGFGVTLSPILGRIIADLVIDGKTDIIDIKPFLFNRFPKVWKKMANNLMIGDNEVSTIIRKYETPLYLYDKDIIIDRVNMVRKAFPKFELAYSFKANPNPAIAGILAKANVSVGVGSIKELLLARKSGFPLNKIIFGGPGKTSKELTIVLKAKIDTIDIESERELRDLEKLGEKYKKKIKVSLRINALHRPTYAREIMSGVPTKYGFDEEAVVDNIKKIKLKYVKIEGVHAHLASQVLNLNSIVTHYEKVAKLSKQIATLLNFKLKLVNFGGGFGIRYSTEDQILNLNLLGQKIREKLNVVFPEKEKPRFRLELGRFFVAESGIFLTKIVDKKLSRKVKFLITDAGINSLSRPAMPWADQHPCSIITKMDAPSKNIYKVVGRSCLAADVLCEEVGLQDPEINEIIAIHNAGAYGYTMSMQFWSGLTMPIEVLHSNNNFKLIRDRRGNIKK
ncbi:MAG: FAD-dependent oxidoreductase [Thermoplasmata archaeon]|nr:FAD-dependent oxidoreductase [Thermoplasmata archaeon]